MSFFDTLKNTFNELKAGSTNLLESDNQEGTVAGPFGMPQRAPAPAPNYDEMVAKGKETASKVGNFAETLSKSLVRDILVRPALDVGEAPIRAGGAVAALAGSEKGAEIAQTVVPPRELPGILGKWLGPVQSYSSEIAQGQKEGKTTFDAAKGPVVDFALNEPAGLAFKPLFLGVGMVAKQFFSKGGEKVIDDIARSTNKDEISGMLPDNIPDKDELANKLVTAKDKGAVEKIIDDHVITRDPSLVKDGSPSASQIDAIVQDYRNTGKVNDFKSPVIIGYNSLIEEARKYKSAEDFVKAQPTYYHTTKAENVISIEKQGFNGDIGEMSKASGGTMQKGVFLYPEKSSAEVFGKNFKNYSVVETKVDGKVYDANTQTKYGWEDELQTQEIAKDKDIITQLKKDGYVGVKSTELGTDAVFVFEPNAVKTKSQLTDIWKKANKK